MSFNDLPSDIKTPKKPVVDDKAKTAPVVVEPAKKTVAGTTGA